MEIYIYVYIYIYMCACLHVCMCVLVYMCTCGNSPTRLCVFSFGSETDMLFANSGLGQCNCCEQYLHNFIIP